MKSLAIALVTVGIAVLVYGVISYSNNRTTIEVGSMSASISDLPMPHPQCGSAT